MDAQQLQQPTPKVAGEDGIAVADEARRQPVQAHHLLEKHCSDLRCRHGFGGWNEVRLFGEPVHHHQNNIVVVARREVGNPVEGHARPELLSQHGAFIPQTLQAAD